MPRRGSKRLAKQASRKGSRRDARTNIYVPETRVNDGSDEHVIAGRSDVAVTDSAAITKNDSNEPTAMRSQRGRQMRVRTDIYTQYLPHELRKLGVLTLGIGIVLSLLTVVLR